MISDIGDRKGWGDTKRGIGIPYAPFCHLGPRQRRRLLNTRAWVAS